jgi:tetratricopeptide (TPR) repeat protein
MFMLCQMIRNAVIRTKDYHRFEPFVGRIYRGFMRSKGLGKNPQEHAGFLYMYAHVLYRNRRFEEAMINLDELRKVIVASGQLLRHMRPKYLLLRAAVKSFSGLCEQAAEDLERALQDATIYLHPRDRLNLLLNLSVYYFQAAKYKEANQSVLRMNHKESWIEKHLGMEWAFKKNLIEVIIFAESGNDDIALSRIRYIESHFSQFFEQRMYRRAKVFTAFIKRIVLNPDVVRDSAFLSELDQADLGLPGDREDIQAITFFCWVKCKVNGTNYYEELLQSVQRR